MTAPDLHPTDPPFSPAQIGALTVVFIVMMAADSSLSGHVPTGVEALLCISPLALTFWLLRPGRNTQ